MDEIRCGEPDCTQMASFKSIVEMANLTDGMMGGVLRNPRVYKCPSGHVTTLRGEFEHLKAALEGKSRDSVEAAGNDVRPESPAKD
jgi:hypothetical protein